jgi:DNA-binding response OmpR family regulator
MLHGKTILLVDDRALIALELEMTLQDAGAIVTTFSIASEAFNWLETNTPSAAVLDYQIGLETLEAIAQTLLKREVPVIFYSGLTDLQDVHLQLQGCTWLNKPCPPEDLLTLLQTLFVEPA